MNDESSAVGRLDLSETQQRGAERVRLVNTQDATNQQEARQQYQTRPSLINH